MSTAVGDLVLIHISEKPATYARVEAIEPDVKPGWWRARLLVLTIPIQMVVWILERDQIDGKPFTMGGTPIRLERVEPPDLADDGTLKENQIRKDANKEGRVISLKNRKKPS